jgi:peptidylprolyl isomerase
MHIGNSSFNIFPASAVALITVALLAACGGTENKTTQTPQTAQENTAMPQNTQIDTSGMTSTPSGLQIKELQPGTGPSPQVGQMVSVHYTGWLTDGTKFDSSVDRGQPLDFTLGAGQVIQGWDEGVASMKIGGKRRLVIPPNLAYGNQSVGGGIIPPNSTLVFDVELLGARNR